MSRGFPDGSRVYFDPIDQHNYAARMARAREVGRLADHFFAEVCRAQGIEPEVALRAPLTMITMPRLAPPSRAIH